MFLIAGHWTRPTVIHRLRAAKPLEEPDADTFPASHCRVPASDPRCRRAHALRAVRSHVLHYRATFNARLARDVGETRGSKTLDVRSPTEAWVDGLAERKCTREAVASRSATSRYAFAAAARCVTTISKSPDMFRTHMRHTISQTN